MEYLKSDEKFVQDLKDDTLPDIIDKLKAIEFDDINIMRKTLHLRNEEKESIKTSNKAKESVYDEIKRDYEKSIFQEYRNFS